MATPSDVSVPLIAVTAAVGAVVLLLVLLCNIAKKADDKDKDEGEEKKENGSSKQKKGQQFTKKARGPIKSTKQTKITFSHPWLAKTFKGPGSNILGLDFSPNGKYMIACSEDRALLVWNVKDFESKEFKIIRGNVDLDHATKVRFSPDSRAFIVSLCNGNSIRVYKLGKKPDGSPLVTAVSDFPQKHNAAEILDIGIASNGKFIMTCFKDTTILIWDLKGEVLATIDTHQMNNTHGAVSPCGRFVASSGFTPDVKVWEVVYDKGSNFKEVTKAFDLKGHKAGVYSFAFNCDSTRMASVSKDGTWKLWNTNVSYQQNQDPKLLYTGDFANTGPCLLAFSPDALTLAIAKGTTISLFDVNAGTCEEELTDVHSAYIKALSFDITSSFLVSTGDKAVQVIHNIPGVKAKIADLEGKKVKADGRAMKERLQTQIDAARMMYDALQKKIKSAA
ncbi:transducin beta-like protein 2 [Lineus longissimus]|uniref:transducin beta-like protein 2 n=1 Tax=Lineus longissimus TaxID=88925 RepID=UPI002B4E9FFE